MKTAIFSCEDAEKWEGWTERLWSGLLRAPGDTFTTFRCHEGEFPDPATCRELYDVILVGGSHHSAYDDLPWIRQLERLLPQYISSGCRVVGCCFGHQLLAKALGGAVGKNPSGRFVLGLEDVSVDVAAARRCGLMLPPPSSPLAGQQDTRGAGGGSGGSDGDDDAVAAAAAPATGSGGARARSLPGEHGTALADPYDGDGGAPGRRNAGGEAAAAATGARRAECSGSGGVAAAVVAGGGGGGGGGGGSRVRLRMLESHGDQVLALPPGASLLATSGTAAYEMWALDNRCLAFQFHPELTPDLVYDKIWRAVSVSGRLNPAEVAAAEAQLKAGPGAVDSDIFLQALAGFMRAPAPAATRPEAMPSAGEEAEEAAAATAGAAAGAAEAAASGGLRVAVELRQALERQAGEAAEAVLGHVRQAASAGMAEGTADAELLTALNQGAAAAYGRAATAAEGAAAQLSGAVTAQQLPLQAALASLGALEAQLDRLTAVVGSLEQQSADMEAQAETQAREARARQQATRVEA